MKRPQGDDILKRAGFSSGNVLVLEKYGPHESTDQTTTSGTFATEANIIKQTPRWDRIVPSGATSVVRLEGEADPSTTTMDVRVRNLQDSETVGSAITGISSTEFVEQDWVSYTPTTTNAQRRFVFQHLSGDGATTVTSRVFALYVGIQL